MRPDRRIAPITVLTPVSRLWSWWLRLSWPLADRSAFVKRPLLGFSFIHVAHWALAERPDGPCVLFQSNFDGPADDYAETFALQVPWRIRGMWQGGRGFPGPRPANDFVRYVLDHAAEADAPHHYYAAYPTATARTVRAALALRVAFEDLERSAAGLRADELAVAWQRFLTREQRHL